MMISMAHHEHLCFTLQSLHWDSLGFKLAHLVPTNFSRAAFRGFSPVARKKQGSGEGVKCRTGFLLRFLAKVSWMELEGSKRTWQDIESGSKGVRAILLVESGGILEEIVIGLVSHRITIIQVS